MCHRRQYLLELLLTKRPDTTNYCIIDTKKKKNFGDSQYLEIGSVSLCLILGIVLSPQYKAGILSDQADLVALNHFAKIDEGIAHTSQCGIDAYSFLFCNLAEREVFIKTKEYNLLLVFWQVGEHLF